MGTVAKWYHRIMANLTIKKIPDELVDRIKAAAEENGRSMNREIIESLESRYSPQPSAEELIAEAKALWERIGDPSWGPYDPDWKREGRP